MKELNTHRLNITLDDELLYGISIYEIPKTNLDLIDILEEFIQVLQVPPVKDNRKL